MKSEARPPYGRYFAYHALFLLSMNVLVLAPNALQLFAGWELVGTTSYLLIGFWFAKPAAARAATKAFWVTKLADMGFMFGLFVLFSATGSFAWDATLSPAQANAVTLLFFFAVVGKSAQFPLHVWLPDAMEGPTPVSALLHAATMVAAGVFLVVRADPLFAQARPRAERDAGDRVGHRPLRRLPRARADRHQEGARLLHLLAARLHGRRARRGLLLRRLLPPHDPRLLQGPPLPRRGQRHPRRPLERDRQDGRPRQEDAAHHRGLRRGSARPRGHPRALRLLQQGRGARSGGGEARLGAVGAPPPHRVRHRVLHGPGPGRGLLRPGEER